jgi:hypothetical protein
MLLLCLLASETAGCLLFTDPINTAPTISITTQDDPNNLLRSKTASFTADAFDPDQSADSLKFDWYQGKTCDKALNTPPAPSSPGLVPFRFRPTELGTGCVAVVVTDNRGATAKATLIYEVVDQAPIAVLEIQPSAGQPAAINGQPYPLALYSQITLSGANSKDPDDPDIKLLSLIWHVYSSNSTEILMPGCPDNSKSPYVCTFATTNPGNYRVDLVVSDSTGKQDTAEQAIQVAQDELPNIVIDSAEPLPPTSPNESLLLAANRDNTFTITRVEDDGDPYPTTDPQNPYPAPPAGFVWSFRLYQTGELFKRWIGDGGPTFTIPANFYSPQETVQVRAEYDDRVTACQPMTSDCRAAITACDPNATICYSSDRRVQWVTWTVAFR